MLRRPRFLVILASIAVTYLLFSNNRLRSALRIPKFFQGVDLCPRQPLLNGIVYNTAKGPKTYAELLHYVYEPFGYEYDDVEGNTHSCAPNAILFPLKYRKLDCTAVFSDWLDIQIKSNITVRTKIPPPQTIPEDLKNVYLLNGFSLLRARYVNNIPSNLPKIPPEPWTNGLINNYFGSYNRSDWSFLPYFADSAAVFFALQQFKPTGQTGMVIGSETPWMEAMALYHGAAELITVESAPVPVHVSNIEMIHPVELAGNWKEYSNMDFVISFSSIEHIGLGRYGDPPDPIGDLRELSKILCLLKQGGLLYIGLPSGPDMIEYNAHRLYGYIRWPMIAAGFEFVGAFHSSNPNFYKKPPPILLRDYHKQYLFVLRKK